MNNPEIQEMINTYGQTINDSWQLLIVAATKFQSDRQTAADQFAQRLTEHLSALSPDGQTSPVLAAIAKDLQRDLHMQVEMHQVVEQLLQSRPGTWSNFIPDLLEAIETWQKHYPDTRQAESSIQIQLGIKTALTSASAVLSET